MSDDDLDDLLRRAMKSLDDGTPPGYFDDLPKQTLARLEDDSSMQTDDRQVGAAGTAATASSTESSTPAPAAAAIAAEPASPPAAAPQREEDSGLHDIRSLATSQRMRLSKRTSQPSIARDDELLAQTSGSWKAVALPEPAKMISLPELTELPSARDVKEADKAARRAEKERAKEEAREAKSSRSARHKVPTAPPAEAQAEAEVAPVVASRPPGEAAAAVEPAAVTPIAAARAKRPTPAPARSGGGSGKKNAVIAIVGLGVAAAAGAAIFVSTQGGSKKEEQAASAERARQDIALPEVDKRFAEPRAPAPAVAAPAVADTAAGTAAAKVEPPAPPPEAPKSKAGPEPTKPAKGIGKVVPNVVEDAKEPDKKPADPNAGKKKEPGDPDFDKLLKEAGYQENKGDGPKLEKKSLSGDDIKKGMNSVAGKVSACYAGQQGSAAVRLTVGPNGQIQKVAVSGVFAGTPVGACVEAAVRAATFPPWDGGPQSINYSYLLSE